MYATRQIVDVRSDVYALGLILYELLAGRGLHPEGIQWHELARCIREEGLRRSARSTAPSAATSRRSSPSVALNHLAALKKEQGKLAESESLYRQALALSRQAMGSSHQNTFGEPFRLATCRLQKSAACSAVRSPPSATSPLPSR